MALRTTDVLTTLFEPVEVGDCSDLVAFLHTHGPAPTDEPEDPFARLLRVARRADRRSAAAIAGHQAAIRRLFPQSPTEAICAFCISEDRGPHPKHIHTTITPIGGGEYVLTGSKRWGSVAPDADLLYVAASIGREGDHNDLRMVAVPTDRPGITFDLEPYLDYGTELRIADITFDEVAIDADDVVPGDAYLASIKPFRLIEDVYNTAGSQIGMVHLGLDHHWPEERLERLVGLICQAASISSTDMAGPEAILLLSDYLRESGAFWTEVWQTWTDAPADVVERWNPDRGLLEVAARARETRRQTAWEALRSR